MVEVLEAEMTNNEKILKRALEMAAWQAQKAGCDRCCKEKWCATHVCPMTDIGCRNLLVSHFIRKAKEDTNA